LKAPELLDPSTAALLGLEWLRAALSPASPYGQRHFDELRPFVAGSEANAHTRAASIAAVAAEIEGERLDAVRGALLAIPDAVGAIARSSMGDILDDPNFLELRRFCSTCERIDELFAGRRSCSPVCNDAIRSVAAALAPGDAGASGFYLADRFSDELRHRREALAGEQAELDAARGREYARVAQALRRDDLSADEFIVMRADLPGALPEGVRVVREAPTYVLCALELGESALAALERRDAAAGAVANAEELVRERLSATVRENAAGLDAAVTALGALDVLVAAARFTQRYECVPATFGSEPMLAFEQARFLPLEVELATAERRFAPLDIALHDVAVLTGPNMGGKSVSLQTCGFVALCAAFGLPVPAKHARVALFDQIAWLGLGRQPQIGGLLSSFAREALELKAILDRAAPRLLILVDEFARTTTPHEGGALLVALLERLRERRACGMLATHLAGIARAAGVRHFAVRGLRPIARAAPTADVGEALRVLAEAMDYSIAEVSADALPRADAIALTELLGVDREFVARAHRALLQ
jgi:DNA mismatch repair protein MutS2